MAENQVTAVENLTEDPDLRFTPTEVARTKLRGAINRRWVETMTENPVTVVGNLAEDPDLRFSPTGVAKASLRIAVNRRWFDRNINDYQEEVSFFTAICWRDLAENVANSLRKGTRVIITGRLKQRLRETEQGDKNPAKSSVVEITIDEIGPSLNSPLLSSRMACMIARRRDMSKTVLEV